MADASGLPPPYLDPSQYPAYQDMQRKQMLAQMLMNSFQQSASSPNPSTGITGPAGAVTPKRGIIQDVAPLVNALMAGKANKSAMQSQADYFNPPSQQQPYQAAPYDANAAAAGPPGIAAQDPSTPGAAPLPQSSGLVRPQNPMIPQGMDPRVAQGIMNMVGPQEYGKKILELQTQRPDIVVQLRAAGIDPNGALGRQIQQQAIAKATNIPPLDVRAGGTLYDPISGKPIFSTPQNGVQTTYDAQGNPSQSVVPGASAAAGTMTSAETAAKVANTPMMVPMGAGTEAPRYPGQIPGLGGPPGAQPPATAPGAPGAAPPSTGPRVAPPAGPAGAQPPAAAKPADLWSTVPRLAIPNTPGQSTDTFHQKLLENAAVKHAELQNTYGQQADLADQKMQYNAEALKALPNAEVGPMSDWLTTNRQRLIEAGVPDGLIPSSGSVTPSLELNKQLTNAALQGARTTFGSRMTQNEVKLQTDEMSPSISMTRDAISSLVNQDNVKNAYTKQRAGDYQTYVQKGGDPLQFEQWYASKRPLQRFASQSQTPPAAIQRLQQNPTLLPDFKKKYGWDPNN